MEKKVSAVWLSGIYLLAVGAPAAVFGQQAEGGAYDQLQHAAHPKAPGARGQETQSGEMRPLQRPKLTPAQVKKIKDALKGGSGVLGEKKQSGGQSPHPLPRTVPMPQVTPGRQKIQVPGYNGKV